MKQKCYHCKQEKNLSDINGIYYFNRFGMLSWYFVCKERSLLCSQESIDKSKSIGFCPDDESIEIAKIIYK